MSLALRSFLKATGARDSPDRTVLVYWEWLSAPRAALAAVRRKVGVLAAHCSTHVLLLTAPLDPDAHDGDDAPVPWERCGWCQLEHALASLVKPPRMVRRAVADPGRRG